MNGPVIIAVIGILGLLIAMHCSVIIVLSLLKYKTIEKSELDYYDDLTSGFAWNVRNVFSKIIIGTEALTASSSIALIIVLAYVFVKYIF